MTRHPAGPARRERAAGTLEYVAAVTAAAIAAVAVVFTAPALGFGDTFSDAVCRVLQRESGCSVLPGSGAGAPGRTRLQAATAGRYVAMGDSYSSGEGAWDYDPGTNVEGNRCHRSTHAYSQVLGRTNTFAGGVDFVACSGAVEAHIDAGNQGEDPQIATLGHDVTLVTMSMGGNDLGFAKVVRDCMINGERGMFFLEKCRDKHDQRIRDRLPELKRTLVERYRQIHDAAPNAHIVIVGYPPLFVEDPEDSPRNMLFREDQAWMNEKAADLNRMLAEAAEEAGVHFVDPTRAFAGHGIGSADPWINDFGLGGPGVGRFDYSASFHPNAAGHAALAELVQGHLED